MSPFHWIADVGWPGLRYSEAPDGSAKTRDTRPGLRYSEATCARTWLFGFVLMVLAAGCSSQPIASTITLATTTSAQDSGLLETLLPLFRDETGIEVKVVAVGSGQAFQIGRRGDADVLLVHDPVGEETFMADAFGSSRRPVMHNDFVLVGPPADPASVNGQASIAEAF